MFYLYTVIELNKEDYVLGIKDAYPSVRLYVTPLKPKVGTHVHAL